MITFLFLLGFSTSSNSSLSEALSLRIDLFLPLPPHLFYFPSISFSSLEQLRLLSLELKPIYSLVAAALLSSSISLSMNGFLSSSILFM
ncbi:hypothetical protein HPP92_013377 [Vanilla planifolia]|uniref:Uncharacterized protein n=1 Tax=Vanilla planifolia TaxID=51239 RepID=A0A835QSX4_VANPL|nr:hypothetical protein HPP92_013377 [Vanilla planifolia]